MDIKVLNSNAEMVDGKIIIKRETEEYLTRDDLIFSKENIKRQKIQLVEQSKNIKKQFDELTGKELEIDEMIALFANETTENPIVL